MKKFLLICLLFVFPFAVNAVDTCIQATVSFIWDTITQEERNENIEQVRSFLNRHTDAKLLPFIMNGSEVETYQRIPGELNADGFFYARFIKE